MPKQQPPDEWSFLRPDVLTDDGALDTLSAAQELAPEVAALHLDSSQRCGAASDPGRSEVDLDPASGTPANASYCYFDDEEPEHASGLATDRTDASDTDTEPDLEEILESQHYAFAPEQADQETAEDQRQITV